MVLRTGSLEAQASSAHPNAPECVQYPQPYRESINGVLIADKLLRELRNRTAAPSSRERANEGENTEAEVPVFFVPVVEHERSSQRQEMDGEVRLAGGRVGEVAVNGLDQYSTSDLSTLPPPYSSHFGEGWYV